MPGIPIKNLGNLSQIWLILPIIRAPKHLIASSWYCLGRIGKKYKTAASCSLRHSDISPIEATAEHVSQITAPLLKLGYSPVTTLAGSQCFNLVTIFYASHCVAAPQRQTFQSNTPLCAYFLLALTLNELFDMLKARRTPSPSKCQKHMYQYWYLRKEVPVITFCRP